VYVMGGVPVRVNWIVTGAEGANLLVRAPRRQRGARVSIGLVHCHAGRQGIQHIGGSWQGRPIVLQLHRLTVAASQTVESHHRFGDAHLRSYVAGDGGKVAVPMALCRGGELLQLRIIVVPGGIHQARDPRNAGGLLQFLRRGPGPVARIVIACDHLFEPRWLLRIQTGEPGQRIRQIPEVPVHDRHFGRNSGPRSGDVSLDEVIIVHGILKGVEHIAPDVEGSRGQK